MTAIEPFEGFSHSSSCAHGTVTRFRIRVLQAAAVLYLALPAGGHVLSLSTVVPGSRLRMRSLQHRLLVAGPQLWEDELISWDNSCLQDLRWWSVAAHLEVGVPLAHPHPDLILYTDALDTGWDASLGSEHLSGLWSKSCSLYSINHRELLAIFLALDGFSQLLRQQSIALSRTTPPLCHTFGRREGLVRLHSIPWFRRFYGFERPIPFASYLSSFRGNSMSSPTLSAGALRS